MGMFGPNDPIVQVTTGNFRTTVDQFDATQLNNKAQNALGTLYYDNAISVLNPNGLMSVYKYVRYNSVTNPALGAAPGVVYYTDETLTVVSGTLADGLGGSNLFAGWLMPNTTDLPNLTAAKLNGNFCWICVGGFLSQAVSPALIVAGDNVIPAAGNFTTTRVASGVALVQRSAGIAMSAVAANKADFLVPFVFA